MRLCKNHYDQAWRRRPEVKERITAYNNRRFRAPQGRYNLLKGLAKKRKLEFNISFELFEALCDEPCGYCGIKNRITTGSGLDRIDTKKGYTSDNVIPSCWGCNKMRGDHLTVEETKVAIKAIMALRASQREFTSDKTSYRE